MPGPANAVVACTSLHHVTDLGEVLNLAGASLVAGGSLVVVEWARERFDEATRPTASPTWADGGKDYGQSLVEMDIHAAWVTACPGRGAGRRVNVTAEWAARRS